MLIDTDLTRPLFVLGQGISTEELFYFIKQEYPNTAQISLEEFEQITKPMQCIFGVQEPVYRRKFIQTNASRPGCTWASWIHSSAVVATRRIGRNVVVNPNSMIGYDASLGDFCCVCPNALISHNAQLATNVFVGPAAVVGGSVNIGNNVFLGLGSMIKDKVTIADDVVVTMTSFVTKDINTAGTHYGTKSRYRD